jgi:hypothetical protein
VNFSERAPSKQWAALKYEGEDFAGVWFKPDDDPLTLLFRIPQKSFHVADLVERLSVENLLAAVGIGKDEVDSWQLEGVSQSDESGASPELSGVLVPPPQPAHHLDIHIRLKSPQQAAAAESGEAKVSAATWQDLEARWKALLGLEAAMEALRQRMESLRAELESAFNKSLTSEEKVHSLNNDVAQWNKAKSRVHHAIPKAKEFIHRATWALGVPERKRLEETFKNYILLHVPCPEMDRLPEQLDALMKDRQILSGHGSAVLQECSSLSAEIQGALRTLHSNAAMRKLKSAARAKGKSG